jgi:NAD(P) transhydrogenase subunit alpha
MLLGIPKEILAEEKRVAATPDTVRDLVASGFEVLVETGAGRGVFFSDDDYRSAGAAIAVDAIAVFDQADMILKVKQPAFNQALEAHEADLLRPGSMLVTFLHPAAPSNWDMVKTLAARGITSFSMDCIPRISRAQQMDALTSMSTVTGYRAVLLAAEHLPRFVPMIGTAIGVNKPAQFLVVGCGVVGLQSVATARRMGGMVGAVDIREAAREESKSLGATVAGFEVPPEVAIGDGGYARSLPDEWVEKEREALAPLVADADVLVLSALVPGEIASILVTEEMVASMKPGSVIVDVSIDQGGNCACTVPGKVAVVADVTIVGTQNIPGAMAVDATRMYSANMLAFVKNLFGEAGGHIRWDDEVVQAALVVREGEIVHSGTRKALSLV